MRDSVNRQQLLGVVQTLDCRLSSVFGTEDRSSRNQHVGSGGDNLLDGLAVDSAVHFDMELWVELFRQFADFRDFRNHIRHERLSAESRLYRHDEHEVDFVDIVDERGRRSRGLEGDSHGQPSSRIALIVSFGSSSDSR